MDQELASSRPACLPCSPLGGSRARELVRGKATKTGSPRESESRGHSGGPRGASERSLCAPPPAAGPVWPPEGAPSAGIDPWGFCSP